MKFSKASSSLRGIQTKRILNPLNPKYNLKYELKTGILIGNDLKNYKIELIDKKKIRLAKL